MNRRTLLTIAVAVVIFFTFFNPFRSRRDREAVPMPYVRRETTATLTEYVEQTHMTPQKLIVEAFGRHDIVFLGEYNHIKQQVEVVRSVIPDLYAAGIRDLGIEFALHADQAAIDQVLTASRFDSAAVQQILFNRMVIWGFQEYLDIFREAWEVNQNREAGEAPFRIVGLNVAQNWEYLETERDLRNPDVVARVFQNGIPDAYMARTIIDEFITRNRKALVYTSLQHAFTDFVVTEYAKSAEEMGLSERRRTGNIIHDRIGSRAATIMFHAPWPDDRSQILQSFPLGGAIDRMMEELPEDLRAAGFFTAGTPFGELSAGRSDFAKGYDDLVLERMCDGYIITGPIGEYEIVTPISNFITAANLAEAVRRFPGANIEDPVTAQQLNEYLAGLTESKQRLVERF